MSTVSHILWDHDGVLVDTEPWYFEATRSCLAQYGVNVDIDDYAILRQTAAGGDRFMKTYAPNAMELASRDVVSRAEQTEINEGRGIDGCVLLDMRHLDEKLIHERLWQIRELGIDLAGVDVVEIRVGRFEIGCDLFHISYSGAFFRPNLSRFHSRSCP